MADPKRGVSKDSLRELRGASRRDQYALPVLPVLNSHQVQISIVFGGLWREMMRLVGCDELPEPSVSDSLSSSGMVELLHDDQAKEGLGRLEAESREVNDMDSRG